MRLGRRKFLAAVGSIGILGAGGTAGALFGDDIAVYADDLMGTSEGDAKERATKATAAETVPPKVKAVEAFAIAFKQHITQYFDGVRVGITKKGEITMEYQTDAANTDAVKQEFHQIAVEYARVLREQGYSAESDTFKQGFKPVTLSIITGKVQGVVPTHSVEAYAKGEIEKKGYIKTIGVTGVERRTTTK